jgi:hypothetical protein
MDLFYSPMRKVIKEELPLCESFPYTFNPNRSKNYYNNIVLNENGEIDFTKVKDNIADMITKFKKDNSVVVIFDNISTIPNGYDSLLLSITQIYQMLSEKVNSKLFSLHPWYLTLIRIYQIKTYIVIYIIYQISRLNLKKMNQDFLKT